MAPPDRLLIVKLSSMGDIAQALPVAAALRRRFAALRITWAVEERFAALVSDHPAIDRMVTFPRMTWDGLDRAWLPGLQRALRGVRAERYDLVLDLQGLLKSSLIALSARVPVRLGVSPQREGAALVSRAVPLPAGRRHAVEQYLACAAYLGATPAPVDFGLRVRPSAAASLTRLLAQRGARHDAPLIAVNPTAARPWKEWPEERWLAVVDVLAEQGTIVLVGGAEQRRRHRQLAARARRPPLDLTGATTLAELIALLDRCALHLAVDTGSLHVAAALGRPVVGIYGPTPPWRLGPYGRADFAISGHGACTVGCPRACVRRRRCLSTIAPDDVIERARYALLGAHAQQTGTAARGEDR